MTLTSQASLSKELWNRIESFDIDDTGEHGCDLPFEGRLARENAWTREYAKRVVGEYKRFVFLAMVAGHPVTPSDQVDQAWHLHLTYTRSYWQRLCGEVLPRPLHHEPTKGGSDEDAKFDDWYSRTRESYAAIFAEPPPTDIWPASAIRFGDDLHYERVNTKHHFVIPKRVAGRLVKFGLIACGTVMLVAGCTPLVLAEMDPLGMCLLIALLIGLILLAMFRPSGPNRRKGSGCDGSGCSSAGWFWGSSGCGSDHGSHSGCGSHADGSGGCASSGCGSSGCSGGGCGGGCGGS